MHIRKLVKAGQTSHTISLPKSWLDKNKLAKGSVVHIHEKSDHELIITPQEISRVQEKKEITINVDKKDSGTLQRELTAAYINNYSSMIFTGKELSEKTKILRQIVQNFVALEVAEQTQTKMVVKDFLNLEEISIDQTLRRMDMIIRSMLKDAISALERKEEQGKDFIQTLEYQDDDINKLYFLLYRLLKSALQNQSIAEKFSLTNTAVLSRWYMIINLEALADCGKTVCKIISSMKSQKKETTKKLYREIQEAYENAMKAFFNQNKEQAHHVAEKRIVIFDSCQAFVASEKSLQAMALAEQFKEMETLICNIAKIVIDHE